MITLIDKEFDNYLDQCYEELEIKQNKIWTKHGIGEYQDYWFNQVTRTLQFKKGGKVEKEFNIICLGTWSHKNNTWMWSWANESLSDECRSDAVALKQLRLKTGFEIFEKAGFVCDEQMAYELTAIGVNYLNALGMYRIPGERSHLFIALTDKKTTN